MQVSFWWWQCSDRYIISLSPHLRSPVPNKPCGFCGRKAPWKRKKKPSEWVPLTNLIPRCSSLSLSTSGHGLDLDHFALRPLRATAACAGQDECCLMSPSSPTSRYSYQDRFSLLRDTGGECTAASHETNSCLLTLLNWPVHKTEVSKWKDRPAMGVECTHPYPLHRSTQTCNGCWVHPPLPLASTHPDLQWVLSAPTPTPCIYPPRPAMGVECTHPYPLHLSTQQPSSVSLLLQLVPSSCSSNGQNDQSRAGPPPSPTPSRPATLPRIRYPSSLQST